MTWLMALFKMEWLAMALLLAAAVTALAARRPGFLMRWVLPGAAIGVLALWALAALGLALYLRLGKALYPDWLYHDSARAVLFFAGLVVIIRRGRRPAGTAPDVRWAASGWPLHRLLLASLAAALLWGGTLWAFCDHAAGQFADARRDARTLALSVKPPPVAEEQNAAPLYERACELIPDPSTMGEAERQECDWSFSWGWEETADPRMLAYLEKMQPALDLLYRATDMPGCRFDRDYEHPCWQAFYKSDLGILRIKSLLRADVRRKCVLGDARGALRDAAGLQALACHMSQGPTLASLMKAVHLQHPWVLEYILARTYPSRDELKALAVTKPPTLERGFRDALILEEAIALAEIAEVENVAFDQTRITGDEPIVVMLFGKPSFKLGLVGWRTFYLAPDLADYRDRMHMAQALAARPYRAVSEEWRQWVRDCEEKPHGLMTGLFLPAAGRLALGISRGMAWTQLADLALAASAYKAQHGRYPAAAGELVPEFIPDVPQDPFDGRPLRMRSVDGELLLYSVGDDGRDDGGAEAGKDGGDITFCLGSHLWRERREKPASRATATLNMQHSTPNMQ